MDFNWDILLNKAPNIMQWVLMGLGSAVVIGTAIDKSIDDKFDKGFMKKAMNIPVVGLFLKVLSRFSPLNFKEKT